MKKFEAPKLSMESLEVEDIITTSNCDEDCTEYVCDWDGGGF